MCSLCKKLRYRRETPLYQLKCCPIAVRIMQTDLMSVWGELSATATFYSTTCIILYTHHCSRLICRTACIPCLSSTDLHTTNLVDVNLTVTVISQCQLLPVLLMTPHISPPVHYHGCCLRWSMDIGHIFSGKASESETSHWKTPFLPTPTEFGAL